MKTLSVLVSALVLVVTLIAFSPVVHGQDVEKEKVPTFSELLESKGKFYIASKILYLTGTTSIVANSPEITVFLPTNYAFRKTGRALGCESVASLDEAVSCITSQFTSQEIARVISYHVLLRVIDSEELLNTNLITSSTGVPMYRKGLKLVDQVPQMKNAKLIPGMLDMVYENGLVHGINGVLLPFTGMKPDDPCDTFEFPMSFRNGSFIPIYKLAQAVRKCPEVRETIVECDVDASDTCNESRGKQSLGSGITIGAAVAAAKNCASVRRAIVDSCDPVSLIE